MKLKTRYYWVSCDKFTAGVETCQGKIVATAPILRRFTGQSMSNLKKWMPSLQIVELLQT